MPATGSRDDRLKKFMKKLSRLGCRKCFPFSLHVTIFNSALQYCRRVHYAKEIETKNKGEKSCVKQEALSLNPINSALTVAGCGGSGGGGDTPPGETTYTVGGMVSGLSGTLVLRNNEADDMTVAQNGAFTFATVVADGGCCSVAIKTQPSGQICTVTNEAGTISGTNVANVSVTCVVPASGSLDTTFGTGGKVITQIGSGNDEAHAIAMQADGKIIAAGSWDNNSGDEEFALVRYNLDGTLDTAFDGDGRVTTDVDVNGSYARAVAIQTDGKIVAAGDANDCFAVARYNTDGSSRRDV